MQKISYLFILLFFSTLLSAKSIDQLSHTKIWLNLLHYNHYNSKSSIKTESFFLSKQKSRTPKDELLATLKYYDENKSIVCKYPARYKWLNKELKLTNFDESFERCRRVKEIIKRADVDSISLVFVSGYMKNPASTFGHSFLKFNSQRFGSNLLDTTLSFGALVPDNENAFLYVIKGITGLYDATYKDKYFFTHDMVYTKTELRDMWEYKLNISKEKIDFLLLHIIELNDISFNYYFFKNNCSYEISKLLELILDDAIAPDSLLYYAPIEPFIKLSKEKKLISKVIYHPSKESYIYQLYQSMAQDEKESVSILIENMFELNNLEFQNLNMYSKLQVLNFMLKYYKYKIVTADVKDIKKLKELKNRVLKTRLSYPVNQNIYKASKKSLVAPGSSNAPLVFSFMGGYSKSKEFYPSLGVTLFSLSCLSQNTLNGDELIVADMAFGAKEGEIFIDDFKLIKIKKFTQNILPFEDFKFSWELEISMKNLDKHKRLNSYDYFCEFGFGKTYFFKDFYIFALIDGSLHSQQEHIRVLPKVGSRVDFGELKAFFYLGYETSFKVKGDYIKTDISLSYRLNKDYSFDFNFIQDESYKGFFGLKYFY